MKIAAIFLIVLVLAAAAGIGWLYFSSNVEVTFSGVIAVDPLDRAEDYKALKASVASDTFVGTLYKSGELPAPESGLFYSWTVHLENKSFLPADTLELRVTPMDGDVLCVSDAAEHTLPAHSSADLSATVLTSRSMHSIREGEVTWYVWGLPFSARLTLGK